MSQPPPGLGRHLLMLLIVALLFVLLFHEPCSFVGKVLRWPQECGRVGWAN